jgi:hypothetical protein
VDPQAIVLKIEDMPTGWSGGPFDRAGQPFFWQNCNPPITTDLTALQAEALAVFTQTAPVKQLSNGVRVFVNEAQAVAFLEGIRGVLANCGGMRYTGNFGQAGTATLAALSFPSYGDETIAFRSTRTNDNGNIDSVGDTVYVRHAEVVYHVGLDGLVVDTAELEGFVRTVDGRVPR